MKFMERFDQINPKIVYILMALALVIPVLKPIGMPLSVNQDMTQPVYDWIDNLAPGSVVVFDAAYSGGSDSELGPQLKAWFYHCMKKGVKVVGIAQWEQGANMAWGSLQDVKGACDAEGISAEYGTDWVFLGYRAGGTNTWRACQNNFWTALGGVDHEGTALEKLPLMAKVPRFDLECTKGIFILSAGSPGIETWTTYFADHAIYVGNVAVQVSGSANQLRAGLIKGILPGLRGAAEYEKLNEKPGLATKLMDAQSLGHLIIMILVVLGNIAFVMKGKGTKKAAA